MLPDVLEAQVAERKRSAQRQFSMLIQGSSAKLRLNQESRRPITAWGGQFFPVSLAQTLKAFGKQQAFFADDRTNLPHYSPITFILRQPRDFLVPGEHVQLVVWTG